MGEHSQYPVVTPGYAPEEQYRKNGLQGPWTDVYALGATFYHAITGQIPSEALERQRKDDLVLPSRQGVEIPAQSEGALLKALAIRAEERFQTVAEFQGELVASPDHYRPWWDRVASAIVPYWKGVALAIGIIFIVLCAWKFRHKIGGLTVLTVVWLRNLILPPTSHVGNLNPPPAVGQLTVTSNVAGARISISGQPGWVIAQALHPPHLGQQGHIFGNLPAGSYSVTGEKAGYQTVTKNVTVLAGGNISIELDLLPTTGQLTVHSTPEGARILIDDRIQPGCVTPCTFPEISAGPHKVTCGKDGYQTVSKGFIVQAGSDGTVNFPLYQVDHGCSVQVQQQINASRTEGDVDYDHGMYDDAVAAYGQAKQLAGCDPAIQAGLQKKINKAQSAKNARLREAESGSRFRACPLWRARLSCLTKAANIPTDPAAARSQTNRNSSK